MHDLYKPFRNYLRQFPVANSLELLWAYGEWVTNGRTLPAQMKFRDGLGQPSKAWDMIYPWELDILVREIVLNGDIRGKRNLDNWANLSIVINKLRKLQNEISARYLQERSILRDLHRVAHHQFPWQRQPSLRTMTRAYMLFSTDAMRPILEERTGIGIVEFFRLGFAVAGATRREPGLVTTSDYAILGVSTETSKRFFDRLTIDLPSLRVKTRNRQHYDDSWAYAVNPLRDYPLVQFDRDHPERVLCPVPTFLLRRFTDGLFYDMVGHPDFANAMGSAFEAYVGKALDRALSKQFNIQKGRAYHDGKNLKHGVDWIVTDDSGHVFIECKTRRLRQEAKFLAEGGIEEAMDTMAGFIVQHYCNIADALAGKTQWQPDEKPIYPMIVTLEDWWIFTPPLVELLDKCVKSRMKIAGHPLEILEKMPFILASADELETAMLIINETGIAKYLGLKREPDHRQWALSAFSPGLFREEFCATRRDLFADVLREVVMPQSS